MKTFLASGLAAVLCAGALMGGSAHAETGADDAALRLRLARQVVLADGGVDGVKTRLHQMIGAMQGPMVEGLPEESRPLMKVVIGKMDLALQNNAGQMLDVTARIYAEKLSTGELQAMAAWMETPAARSIRAKMPDIQRELILRQGPMMKSLMREMVAVSVEEACKEKACTPQDRAAAQAAVSKALPSG